MSFPTPNSKKPRTKLPPVTQAEIDKARRAIEKAQYSLLRYEGTRALAGVILMGDKTITTRVNTGATDGINEVYNPRFVNSLPQKQVTYLVLHEVGHKALKHLRVWKNLWAEDARTANMAMDFVVNWTIEAELDPTGEVTAPIPGRLINPDFAGWNARQVYDFLKAQQGGSKPGDGDEESTEPGDGDEDADGEGEGEGGGGHGQPSPKKKDSDDEDGDEDGEGGEGGDVDADDEDGEGDGGAGHGQPAPKPKKKGSSEADGTLDDHDWEGAKKVTDKQIEDIDRAVRQGSLAGKKKLSNAFTEVVTPWEEILRAFITDAVAKGRDDSSWARPSRRWLARGEYRPSPVGSSMTRLVVAVDTSGSITAADLAQFMGEINAACRAAQPEWLSVLWWDAALAGEDHVYQPADSDVSHVLRPAGGGGTDPSVLVPRMDTFSPAPSCLIVLTDGMFDKYPAFKVPTLWALTSTINRDTPPAGAVVVHI
jgi:predicted metal-dependent peptidase